MIAIAAVILLGVGIWAIFFSKLFLVTKIDVKGDVPSIAEEARSLINGQIGEKRLVFGRQSNLILFNKNELEKKLQSKIFFRLL